MNRSAIFCYYVTNHCKIQCLRLTKQFLRSLQKFSVLQFGPLYEPSADISGDLSCVLFAVDWVAAGLSRVADSRGYFLREVSGPLTSMQFLQKLRHLLHCFSELPVKLKRKLPGFLRFEPGVDTFSFEMLSSCGFTLSQLK